MNNYRKGALSTEYLKSILHYDQETGLFTWLIAKGRRIKTGDIAGMKNEDNYIVIKIDEIKYLAHRLAWFYMTGEWPKNEIDHKNGITDNNKWMNLREAKHVQNAKNRKLNINSSTGLKGVHKRGEKYRSKISFNGKQICLGTFDTKEEASMAYAKASEFYFGKFVRSDLNV